MKMLTMEIIVGIHATILYILATLLTESSAASCFSKHLFSTKTPYIFIKKPKQIPKLPSDRSCYPIQINMLHRHGHHYPTTHELSEIKLLKDVINKAAVNSFVGVDLKYPWKFPINASEFILLTQIGEKELFYLGKKTRERFPELFIEPYSPQLYKFQSTCALRSSHSTNSLAGAIFEGAGTLGKCKYQPIAITTSSCYNDPILLFTEYCKRYKDNVKNETIWFKEMYDFENGEEVREVLDKVTQKLSMNKQTLKPKDLKYLFVACSYEMTMLNGTLSKGICSLFDKDDHITMEYLYDLKQFYKISGGHELNYIIACELLKDIINSLLDARDKGSAYIGIFRSGDAETLIPLLTLLGLFRDETKLTAKNFVIMRHRSFRPACISPFAGNLYFVLYRCKDEKYKIQLYVNEKLEKLRCCRSISNCDFDMFLKCYQDILDRCNLDEMCNND